MEEDLVEAVEEAGVEVAVALVGEFLTCKLCWMQQDIPFSSDRTLASTYMCILLMLHW